MLLRAQGALPEGEVSDDPGFLHSHFSKADIKREGTDVTIVANLLYVKRALEAAADEAGQEGISAEVIAPDPGAL